jgi:hypothetical protein
MNEEMLKNFGPLKSLEGIWEGVVGDDIGPGDDRGTENNKYRERTVFESTGVTKNHEQSLYGYRYHTQAFRIGESDPFHDEVGYWHWDPAAKQVFKSITIPRGEVILAGGNVEPGDKSFRLYAELGSATFGVCSNPFLDKEFQTVGFTLDMKFNEDGSFSYDQNTVIQIKGQPNRFEHRDKNTLRKISPT